MNYILHTNTKMRDCLTHFVVKKLDGSRAIERGRSQAYNQVSLACFHGFCKTSFRWRERVSQGERRWSKLAYRRRALRPGTRNRRSPGSESFWRESSGAIWRHRNHAKSEHSIETKQGWLRWTSLERKRCGHATLVDETWVQIIRFDASVA